MAQNWFKHDYSARNDEKILELRAEYGWKGYGLFFALIESMCETETGCIDIDRIGGLCVALGVPKDELLGFIEYCLEVELFYEDDDGLIKNKRVIEHLDHMNTLKEAGKKGANKRWKRNNNRGAIKGGNGDPNADKTRLDKIREDNTTNSVGTQSADLPSVAKYGKEATDVANYLLEAICEYDPTHRYNVNPPAINSWIIELERAIRLDGRTQEQLNFIIDYIYRHNGKHSSFWAGNVESGEKLRKQFDKIKNQIRSERQNGKQQKRENINNSIQQLDELEWD